MDGFEATKIIISLIGSGKIPKLSVIACTANASPKDYEICFKTGMVDCPLKPFSKTELSLKIKKHLQIKNELTPIYENWIEIDKNSYVLHSVYIYPSILSFYFWNYII